MEEEFIRNQERLKPQEERNEEERYKQYMLNIKAFYCDCLTMFVIF